MTCHNSIASENPGAMEQLVKFHISVTIDARIGCTPCLIGSHKPVDNFLAKVISKVENIVWNAQLSGDRSGVLYVIQAAA